MMWMWTDIGLFSATLLWAAFWVKLGRRWLPRPALIAVALVALAVGMVPVNNLVIGSYVFSLTSYLSIPSILLLLAMLLISCCGESCERIKLFWSSPRQWQPVYGFFALSGLILYPMAGGLSLFDSYRLGFAEAPLAWLLPLYLLVWCGMAILYRWYLLLVLLISSVLAYFADLLPSLNLWDYVTDLLIVLYSFFGLLKLLFWKVFKRPLSTDR